MPSTDVTRAIGYLTSQLLAYLGHHAFFEFSKTALNSVHVQTGCHNACRSLPFDLVFFCLPSFLSKTPLSPPTFATHLEQMHFPSFSLADAMSQTDSEDFASAPLSPLAGSANSVHSLPEPGSSPGSEQNCDAGVFPTWLQLGKLNFLCCCSHQQ